MAATETQDEQAQRRQQERDEKLAEYVIAFVKRLTAGDEPWRAWEITEAISAVLDAERFCRYGLDLDKLHAYVSGLIAVERARLEE